jgi:hypothetical protein
MSWVSQTCVFASTTKTSAFWPVTFTPTAYSTSNDGKTTY